MMTIAYLLFPTHALCWFGGMAFMWVYQRYDQHRKRDEILEWWKRRHQR